MRLIHYINRHGTRFGQFRDFFVYALIISSGNNQYTVTEAAVTNIFFIKGPGIMFYLPGFSHLADLTAQFRRYYLYLCASLKQ